MIFKPVELFAERATVQEAFDYGHSIGQTCGENAILVYTSQYVIYNTMAKIANKAFADLRAEADQLIIENAALREELAQERADRRIKEENAK